MKKLVSVFLAAVMMTALFAGCGNAAPAETTAPAVPETTAPAGPASALELLETVWNAYGEDEKFAIFGGNAAAFVENAPGNFDLADESITGALVIPAEQLANVTEVASMTHMMNSNTFTCAAYKLAEGVSAEDFLGAMREAIANNQWICGFPEVLVTSTVSEGYVVVAFGAEDLVDIFDGHLGEVYPQRENQNKEVIA